MFHANWPEQHFDSELVVRLAGYVFADERRMIECEARIPAPGSRVEGQFGGERIAVVPQYVPPGTLVRRPRGFRRNARSVVQELFDRDLRFAWIAQRLGLWDEVERGIVEVIFFGVSPNRLCSAAIESTVAQTAFETDATRRAAVFFAVSLFDLQCQIAVPNDHG